MLLTPLLTAGTVTRAVPPLRCTSISHHITYVRTTPIAAGSVGTNGTTIRTVGPATRTIITVVSASTNGTNGTNGTNSTRYTK